MYVYSKGELFSPSRRDTTGQSRTLCPEVFCRTAKEGKKEVMTKQILYSYLPERASGASGLSLTILVLVPYPSGVRYNIKKELTFCTGRRHMCDTHDQQCKVSLNKVPQSIVCKKTYRVPLVWLPVTLKKTDKKKREKTTKFLLIPTRQHFPTCLPEKSSCFRT